MTHIGEWWRAGVMGVKKCASCQHTRECVCVWKEEAHTRIATHTHGEDSCIRRKLWQHSVPSHADGPTKPITHTHTFKLVINVYRYYLCPDPLLLALGKSFRWLQTMKCKQITARKLHNMAAKNVDLWVPSGNIIKTMTLQALEHGWWDAVGASKYFPNRRKRQMRLFIG